MGNTWLRPDDIVPFVHAAQEDVAEVNRPDPVVDTWMSYAFLRDNVRLPCSRSKLDDVAAYFRLTRCSRIANGLEALIDYGAYRRARGTEKRRLERALTQYNREDLRFLAEIVKRLREIR